MNRLWIYLKEYRKESVLAPLFKLLEALMDLLVPVVVAEVINRGIRGQDSGVAVRCFLLLMDVGQGQRGLCHPGAPGAV